MLAAAAHYAHSSNKRTKAFNVPLIYGCCRLFFTELAEEVDTHTPRALEDGYSESFADDHVLSSAHHEALASAA